MVIAKATVFERELPPAGTHQAVCIAVYDLGLQEESWQGKSKVLHKVLFRWELNKKIEKGDFAGKRFCVNKKYTLSLSDKATLTADLISWLGKNLSKEDVEGGIDLDKFVGRNCLLAIAHNNVGDKTYANITSISPLMDGMNPLTRESGLEVPNFVKQIQEKAIKRKTNPVAQAVAEAFDGEVLEDETIPF